MGSPVKPFACAVEECGMTFTNEDHLTVHSKKHDMALQLGLGQKATGFPADQTPTPTRFIRNCEEVGLFQDLQNVNPFDEGFKRAMEAKSGMLISLDSAIAAATSDDALHTPHIFPNLTDTQETTLFNPGENIPASSEESSTVIESAIVETKHSNEVTTIIGKDQNIDNDKVIKIHSNVHICKSDYSTIVSSNEGNYIKIVVNKDLSDVIKRDVMLTDTGKMAPAIISQQSLDFAIDSLTSHVESKNVSNDNVKKHNLIATSNIDNANTDLIQNINIAHHYISKDTLEKNTILNIDTMKNKLKNALQSGKIQTQISDIKDVEIKKRGRKRRSIDIKDIKELDFKKKQNYEVMIKLPNGELVHMQTNALEKPVAEAKQKLKDALENKMNKTTSEEIFKLKNSEAIGTAVIPLIATDKIPVLAVYSGVANNANGVLENNMFKLPQLAPSPSGAYPVALIRRKVGIPANKHFEMSSYKKVIPKSKTDTKKRKKEEKSHDVTDKLIQHKSDCEIFEKLYGQCNKNCGENEETVNVNNANETDTSIVTCPSDESDGNKIKAPVEIVSEISQETDSVTVKITNCEYSDSNTDTNKVTCNLTETSTADTAGNTHVIIHSATVVNNYSLNSSFLVSDTINDNVSSSKIITDSPTIGTKKPSNGIIGNRNRKGNFVTEETKKTEAEIKKEMSVAAVRRYRSKQTLLRQQLIEGNKVLTANNHQLTRELEKTKSELATLKALFVEHLRGCNTAPI